MAEEAEEQNDGDYLRDKLSWCYDAIHRVPRLREALGELLDPPEVGWNSDDETDLSNKVLIGLQQLEIEDLREQVDGLREPRRWRLLLRTKDEILYQSPTGQVAKVPIDLADVITRGVPFEGEIEANGTDLVFSVGDDIVAEVPRSLVLQLRGPGTESDGGEGGAGARPDRRGRER